MTWYVVWKTIVFISDIQNSSLLQRKQLLLTIFLLLKDLLEQKKKKFSFVYSLRIRVFFVVLFLSVQSTYLYVFYSKVTIPYSFKDTKSFRYKMFIEFSLFGEKFFCFLGFEIFFLPFSLISLRFSCLLCGKYFTLLSMNIFLNVICFTENNTFIVSFDGINSKQQI